MVVRFAQVPEVHRGSSSKARTHHLSPCILEEGGDGGLLPSNQRKVSFLEYYHNLDLESIKQDYKKASYDSSPCMASAWRVISFFLVVFVLPTVLISLPLYARYHLYHARHLPMTETDTRALNHAVSSFWCQGQRVTSNGTLDAFLVAGSPKVQKERRHVSLRRHLTLQHDDIEYWGVYLIEGSSFVLSSTARWPGGTMLVVQGEENLHKCFYRESRLQEELNGGPSSATPNVYKGIPDFEDDINNDNKNNLNTKTDAVEDGGHGGEVFDEEDNEDLIRMHKTTQSHDIFDLKDDADLIPLLEEPLNVSKHNLSEKKDSKSKQKGERRKKKGKKDKNERKERQARSVNFQSLERMQRDASLSDTASQTLELDKLNLIHKFNDTIDVTTGNSSFSSSEEFLQQCRNTILAVDLSPYPNWDVRVLNMKANNPDTWHIKVNSSDYYYFIFTSDNSIELNYIGFNLELQRATYDVSSPIESCRNSTECVFPLAFTQTEAVVVEVPGSENLQELHSFEVTTTCQPRVPVYMVFILLVPFIILLFAFQ